VSEDLIDWLRAQIDTCETKNLRVLQGDNWDWFAGSESGSEQALREVGIFRKLLDLHSNGGMPPLATQDECRDCVDVWPCATVRLLAAIFSDRPGFREEWRPQ
jgi:hypothetical protein